MVYLATLHSADAASGLVRDMTRGHSEQLLGISRHLPDDRLFLDRDRREVWRVTSDGSRWTVQTTEPAACLDLIRQRAGTDWPDDPAACEDYRHILETLPPASARPVPPLP